MFYFYHFLSKINTKSGISLSLKVKTSSSYTSLNFHLINKFEYFTQNFHKLTHTKHFLSSIFFIKFIFFSNSLNFSI